MPIFNSNEEMQAFIANLDDTTPKWSVVDNDTNEVVVGCESMTDRAQYVWIMENQVEAKYGLLPLDPTNYEKPWLDPAE
jgi:hypothetical protein